MNHMRARPVTIFGLLLIAILAALLWQPHPNYSQKRQDHLDNALLEAAAYDNAATVRDLLRSGANPNACQQPASLREKLEKICPAVRHIYQSDPPPLYETALGTAVLNYKPDVVRVLLAGGADVTRKDSYGQTPLDLVYLDKGDKIFLMLTEAARMQKLAVVPAARH